MENPDDSPISEPPFSPPAGLSKGKQILIGGLMMGFWLIIGLATMKSSQSRGAGILFMIPALMMGFYVWGVAEIFEKSGGLSLIDQILRVIPEFVFSIILIGTVIGMAIMWLMILLRPLFGDWRGRLWLLFLIQNLYAAVQALVHPDFW